MTATAIPEGFGPITPHLTVKGASDAIDFYKEAFGAEEVMRMPLPDNPSVLMHAEIRLLGVAVAEVQADRLAAAKQLAARVGGVAVLKGAGSVLADESGPLGICAHGNPGMATAGSGDVLSGILGALLAQGVETDIAAKYGVVLHAKAGDDIAQLYGQRGMIASDLFDAVRALINH